MSKMIETVAYLPLLLRASLVNLELLFALLVLGFVAGTSVALAQSYASVPARVAARAFEWIFRGIPALVLLFLFYFGPAQFGVRVSPFVAASVALGLRSAAYQSQIFRGALESVSHGQMIAARSLGMSRNRAIYKVILPQAFRLAIPGWSNELSAVVKDTTLAYAVGLNDIMRTARVIYDRHYELAMPALLMVALLFFVITEAGTALLAAAERRTRTPVVSIGEAMRTLR
ncbi:amino acid ABC transporter permease [Candidatus Bipolaricaulota bacterium]|nr:amino acid ABC transporter permease [Candidatus Bipolaricaulota bacterium]